MTDIAILLSKARERCRLVSEGVAEVDEQLRAYLPFRGDALSALPLQQRTAALAFLKRFEQLQDLTGRLCRAMLAYEGQDTADLTQRDIGNWLAKLGFVADELDWLTMSRLRNRLVHEYPLEESEQIDRLNESWTLMPDLLAIARALDDDLGKKGFAA